MSNIVRLFQLQRFWMLLLLAAVWLVAGQGAWSLQFERETVARRAEQQFGREGGRRLNQWFSVLDRLAHESDARARLAEVNGFWNTAIREAEDMAVWRRDDYWATPLEALGRGRGDCEDFVIGKYFSLVHLGVPPEKLRLIYVRAQVDGRSVAHMVLGYYDKPDSEPLILDNLVHRIEPASRRRDLTPVFSFNAHAVFVKGSQSAGVDRITRWQDLLARMRQEGFTP